MMGYSTKGVMIVYVTIIGIEIGIVVEVVQPRSPPNVIALDAHSHHRFSLNTRKYCVTIVLSVLDKSKLNL